MPLGMRFGSSTTAAATTGPASGPRPASSQPATGQMPRLISARSRRKLGGVTATRLSQLGLIFRRLFYPNHGRIVRKQALQRNREPWITPRYSVGDTDLILQMHAAVIADLDTWCDHDFPGMTVGIGKIAGIAAVIGGVSRFQHRSAL